MAERRTTRDDRDPTIPLHKPPFGDPVWAGLCPKCELWYPWAAFHKRVKLRNGKTRASHYVRCLVCRTKAGATRQGNKASR